ncbi:MAG: hypothetical protein L0J74_10795 [Corynebacterium sp.]|uniref:hypothetical protein n=1 Tax=Corynebacterium sp. TaxID=1720 RepID=UPI0026487EE2|nr:hypothetical protein [Corynebacterium sp.]MDN6282822.1 hypothetical protein [Corynebacterium sp.]MDN6306267.1 hypothetical protein [Corynebacterium sp.]MDN6351825.1 hypothetical protein [Corynebacterium sp.]MDN6366756.1 hypothetical protein [Corynebacterium sp.]MDN6374646.1 hypothetical protein [Corynebacterium sp.]
MTDRTDNTPPDPTPHHPDSDGIPDQVTLEDTVVTPLDRRDPYRFFWLVCQIALWISAVAATIAIIIGAIVDSDNSLLAGIAFLIISMLSIIGILLSRIGSDLKGAGVM